MDGYIEFDVDCDVRIWDAYEHGLIVLLDLGSSAHSSQVDNVE